MSVIIGNPLVETSVHESQIGEEEYDDALKLWWSLFGTAPEPFAAPTPETQELSDFFRKSFVPADMPPLRESILVDSGKRLHWLSAPYKAAENPARPSIFVAWIKDGQRWLHWVEEAFYCAPFTFPSCLYCRVGSHVGDLTHPSEARRRMAEELIERCAGTDAVCGGYFSPKYSSFVLLREPADENFLHLGKAVVEVGAFLQNVPHT